ncbi:MAG: twin-arginine translocation signal domain-containing protein, partial [Succinivibrio sp.]
MHIEKTVSPSRRGFLKLSAVAAGAVLASAALPSFAKGAALKKVRLSDIPSDNIEMAKGSELVQNAYKYLLSKIDTLRDSALKAKVRGLYEDTTPTFMRKWEGKDGAAAAYKALQAQNLVDPSKTPVESLFPAVSDRGGKGPQ